MTGAFDAMARVTSGALAWLQPAITAKRAKQTRFMTL